MHSLSFWRRAGMAALIFSCTFLPCIARETGALDKNPAAGRPARSCGISTQTIKQLAAIENVADNSFQCLGLAMDGQTVRSIRLETHHFTPGHAPPDGEKIAVTAFSATMVASTHGAVLDGVPGHDAIILQGTLAGQPDRIVLNIRYLYNGFTGEYRNCPVMLDRAGAPRWRLVNGAGQTISRILIQTRNMPVIGAFGIASLDGACS